MSKRGGVIRRVERIVCYLQHKHRYIKYHYSDTIKKPLHITPQFIELGTDVSIWYNARIEGVKRYNDIEYSPRIIIRDRVSIQQNIHLTCANYIEIGENTAIAANVTITDIHHPYDNIDIPIERQNLVVKSVVIGSDCKIYNNAVILPGTIIGHHVTIGANSVVRGVIPDYSVIAGIPARIIKSFDFNTGQWLSTKVNSSI